LVAADKDALFGRFDYAGELGRGATARVIRVADRAHGGRVRALKVVPAEHASRLAWEMARLRQVSDPRIAAVHELLRVDAPLHAPFGLARDSWVLVQDLAPGKRVDALVRGLREEGGAWLEAIVRVGIGVAEALHAIHASGLVHGDVKPANALATHGAERVTLIDLGMARAAGFVDRIDGTPAYLAPEAWAGACTPARDLYALGALLFDLLAGSELDAPSRSEGRAHALRREEQLPNDLPRALTEVVMRALSSRPEARPQTAAVFAAQLQQAARKASLGVDARGLRFATGRVLMSDAERAARALNGPFLGHEALRRALAEAMTRAQVIAVSGERGAGRSRLIREALADAQLELSERGESPPVLLAQLELERLPAHALLHVYEGTSQDVEDAQRAVAAAHHLGKQLTVVVEVEPNVASRVDVSFAQGPLDRADIAGFLRLHLEQEPSAALIDAALRAAHGLAGRLCGLLAQGFTKRLSLVEPGAWDELDHELDERGLSSSARTLLVRMALAGRALDIAQAQALYEPGQDAADPDRNASLATDVSFVHARDELGARGLLRMTERGAEVSPALARRVRMSLSEAARDARAVEAVLTGGLSSPWAAAWLGTPAVAQQRFVDAADELARSGDTQAVHGLLEEARLRCDGAELRIRHARALRALGRYHEAASLLEDVPSQQARLSLAEIRRLEGKASEALALLSELDASSSVHALRARTLLDLGRHDEAAKEADHAVAASEPLEAVVMGLEVRALLALLRDEPSRALAEELVSRSRLLRQPRRIARALIVHAEALTRDGARGLASEALREARAQAAAAGELHEAATITVNLGLSAFDAGDLGSALTMLREGAARLSSLGKQGELGRTLLNLGNAAWLAGDVELASTATHEGAVLARSVGDVSAVAFCCVLEAELALHRGEFERARRWIEDALSEEDRLPGSVLGVVAARAVVAHVAMQSLERAEERLSLATTHLSPREPTAASELAVARARFWLARGDAETAEKALLGSLSSASQSLAFDGLLRLLLTGIDSARALGNDGLMRDRVERSRALLERALSSLPAPARVALRALPAYNRVLVQSRAHPLASEGVEAEQAGAWRRLVAGSQRLFAARSESALAKEAATLALELVHAERALIIARKDDGELRLLGHATLASQSSSGTAFSRSVVERMWAEMTPLVTTDARDDERLDAAQSVHALSVRSVVAVPVRAFGGQAALYLDDRLRTGAFGVRERELLVDLARLTLAASRALESLREERKNARRKGRALTHLERELAVLQGMRADSTLIGTSEPLRRAIMLAQRAAVSDVPVLIRGESGTGKELVARLIHDRSTRKRKPFVVESCASLPEPLLESALFGHVRGAFTGADRPRAGLFETAHGGTLFLDEVGEMSPALQAKLLRVLAEGEIRPLGSDHTRRVNIRLLTATHRDLAARVESGEFRQDLYYRIAVVDLLLPALRDRLEDVPLLAAHFIERYANGRKISLTSDALGYLQARSFPGNVRQLEALIRRALAFSDDVIDVEHLEEPASADAVRGLSLHAHTDALQKRLVRAALAEARGNQTRAAELLGVSRFGLQKMLKRLAL
jgi:transcriptional regulator with GAF, ATPase, and Fis domain/tRNA A-37 threonylcarbamoyl transferase component Bud32